MTYCSAPGVRFGIVAVQLGQRGGSAGGFARRAPRDIGKKLLKPSPHPLMFNAAMVNGAALDLPPAGKIESFRDFACKNAILKIR
jgi:hypothetical protein